MADESILQIVIAARDEASAKIKEIGDSVDKAGKTAMNMSAAFKIAGAEVLGAGVAGVGMMKMFADAASQHQVAMASVDATLKNVSSTLETSTEIIGDNTSAVGSSKKAIQEHIKELELQKAQLTLNNAEQTTSVTVTTGHGKTLKEHTKIVHENKDAINAQKMAIDQQIISLKESELGMGKSAATTGGITKIIDNASLSYANLTKTANSLSDSYLKLGFVDHDTQLAFAQDVRVTKDVADAKTMLAASADLARLKNVDLGTATTALTMAYEGNTRSLKALGIEVPKGSKGMENITAVEKAAAGQAEAFSKTYEGASQVLSVNIEKLKVSLGDRLLPTLTQFMASITGVIERLNSLSPKTYDTIINILKFGTAFALIAGPILLVLGFLPAVIAGVGFLAGAFLPLTLILGTVALAAYLLYTNWGQLSRAFNEILPVIRTLGEIASLVFQLITLEVKKFIIDNKATFQAFWIDIVGLFNFSLGFLQGFWETTWRSIANFLAGIWLVIKGVVEVAWGLIMIVLDVGMGLFTGNWNKAWEGIKKGLGIVWDGIKSIIEGAMLGIINGIISMANIIVGVINGLIKGIDNVASKIPGVKFNIPTLPSIPSIGAFEQGGYVPQTGIAMLHQGEFVLSKDMLSGKQPAPSYVTNNSTSQPIIIYATINSEMDLALLGNKIAFAVRNSR